tara:strand:+ start:994 stop:1251 length:258 start_codon:yes stop_codon:yes gene_type:complete
MTDEELEKKELTKLIKDLTEKIGDIELDEMDDETSSACAGHGIWAVNEVIEDVYNTALNHLPNALLKDIIKRAKSSIERRLPNKK